MFSQILIHQCEQLAHRDHHSFADLTRVEQVQLGRAILKDTSLSLFARGLMAEAALKRVGQAVKERIGAMLCRCSSWAQVFEHLDECEDVSDFYINITRQQRTLIDDELRALS